MSYIYKQQHRHLQTLFVFSRVTGAGGPAGKGAGCRGAVAEGKKADRAAGGGACGSPALAAAPAPLQAHEVQGAHSLDWQWRSRGLCSSAGLVPLDRALILDSAWWSPPLYSCCRDNKRLWLGSIAETISFVHGCSSWMFRLQGCRPGTGGSEIRSAAGSPAAPAAVAAPMPAAQPGSAADPQSCSAKQAPVGGLAASKHGGQSAGELSDGPAACRYAASPPPPPPSLPDTQRGRQCQRAATQPDDHHPAAERVW